MAGAILASVALKEHDLATTLLAQIWPNDHDLARVAEIVLTRALAEGSDDTKITAASVLSQNAGEIQHEDFNIWPIPGPSWNSHLPANSRLALIDSAAKWLIGLLGQDAQGGTVYIRDPAVVLYEALNDEHASVRGISVACLRAILPAWSSKRKIDTGAGELTKRKIEERLKPLLSTAEPVKGREYRETIERMVAGLPNTL